MARNTYTQCVLRKGDAETVSFIPSKFAKVGSVLKLEDNGQWDDGWRVISVGTTVDKVEHVPSLIREHRKNTKDSMKNRAII
jgi:hypothetical protein